MSLDQICLKRVIVDKYQLNNLQICIDHIPCIHFCEKRHAQERVWSLHIFFHSHNCQGGTGKFIYVCVYVLVISRYEDNIVVITRD